MGVSAMIPVRDVAFQLGVGREQMQVQRVRAVLGCFEAQGRFHARLELHQTDRFGQSNRLFFR